MLMQYSSNYISDPRESLSLRRYNKLITLFNIRGSLSSLRRYTLEVLGRKYPEDIIVLGDYFRRRYIHWYNGNANVDYKKISREIIIKDIILVLNRLSEVYGARIVNSDIRNYHRMKIVNIDTHGGRAAIEKKYEISNKKCKFEYLANHAKEYRYASKDMCSKCYSRVSQLIARGYINKLKDEHIIYLMNLPDLSRLPRDNRNFIRKTEEIMLKRFNIKL